MIHPHDAIRNFITLKKNLLETPCKETLENLKKIQWDQLFWQMCKNRMIQGAFRYSDQNVQRYQLKHKKNLRYIKDKVDMYEKDGNVEHLFDIGNAAMIEFGYSTFMKQHFSSEDDKNHAS
jgi:hypothetical protein